MAIRFAELERKVTKVLYLSRCSVNRPELIGFWSNYAMSLWGLCRTPVNYALIYGVLVELHSGGWKVEAFEDLRLCAIQWTRRFE